MKEVDTFLKTEHTASSDPVTLEAQLKESSSLQVSILSTFCAQLLHVQILKAQKWQSSHQCLFALFGSTCIKAGSKTLMKLTTGRPHYAPTDSRCHQRPRYPTLAQDTSEFTLRRRFRETASRNQRAVGGNGPGHPTAVCQLFRWS